MSDDKTQHIDDEAEADARELTEDELDQIAGGTAVEMMPAGNP